MSSRGTGGSAGGAGTELSPSTKARNVSPSAAQSSSAFRDTDALLARFVRRRAQADGLTGDAGSLTDCEDQPRRTSRKLTREALHNRAGDGCLFLDDDHLVEGDVRRHLKLDRLPWS
jgi:hypothetical protein